MVGGGPLVRVEAAAPAVCVCVESAAGVCMAEGGPRLPGLCMFAESAAGVCMVGGGRRLADLCACVEPAAGVCMAGRRARLSGRYVCAGYGVVCLCPCILCPPSKRNDQLPGEMTSGSLPHGCVLVPVASTHKTLGVILRQTPVQTAEEIWHTGAYACVCTGM